MFANQLPAVKDPILIAELSELERFQRIENEVLCRLAGRASGCAVHDRWRAILVLRDRPMPLPVPPMAFRGSKPSSYRPLPDDMLEFLRDAQAQCSGPSQINERRKKQALTIIRKPSR